MFFSRFLFWFSGSKSTLLKRNIFLNIVSWNFLKYMSRFLSYFVSGVALAGVLETNGVLYENAVISTRNSEMQHDCSNPPAVFLDVYFFLEGTFGWIWWNLIHFIEPSNNIVGEIRCPRKLMCMSVWRSHTSKWDFLAMKGRFQSRIHISLLRLQQFVSVIRFSPETLQPWLTVNIFI